MENVLELTVHVGERDRGGGRLLSDVLMDAYERHGVRRSLLLRGLEGFGIKHRLQTERLLTLSEDLPILALAIDSPELITGLMEEVRSFVPHGLITLERARLLEPGERELSGELSSEELKLTVHVGRQEPVAGRQAYVAVVDCLQRHGLSGASVLLGLDGVAHGVRRRARFFSANADVPVMIVSVGGGASIVSALAELQGMLERPTITLERVQVCKRDGALLAVPEAPSTPDASGLARWQKLVIYASESSRHAREPLHSALIRRLRAEGAAGATAMRGVWGYHGEHQPHGERFWSLSRQVPVLTLALDTPENIRRWFEIVDEVTDETGLVTSEVVPALRAAGPELEHGGLRLATPSSRRQTSDGRPGGWAASF
jgi:PII-like signaling protein